jgi:hypothetical protein
MRSRTRLAPPLLAAVLAGSALLSGCGGDEPTDSASATSTPVASGAAEPGGVDGTDDDGAAAASDFPGDAEPDTAEASAGARLTVSDIRIGRHDGFDRVVFEVGGEGAPGWDVRYVDAAGSQGSGEPIDPAGEAILQVTLTGMGYPYDTGVEEWSSSGPVTGDGTRTVTELVWDATFEGTSVAFVGTTGEAPFRVYLLEGPTRLVVEVADAT